MSHDTSDYDLGAIRKLLLEAFTAEDLHRFCMDDPLFQPICGYFGSGHGLAGMVDEVIDYCRTRGLLPKLLATVQQARPEVYARFERQLRRPTFPADASPSPPVSPEPTADDGIPPSRDTKPPLWKTVLSKPIFWLVLAVLILLVVICLLFYKPPAVTVAMETMHGRYVTAMDGNWDPPWVLRAETEDLLDCEKFTLLCQGDVQVALQTCHKTETGNHRYVTALGNDNDHDWLLIGETDVIDAFERFTFVDADTGIVRRCPEVIKALKKDEAVRVALKTVHNRYVTAMDSNWYQPWVLRAGATEMGESEKFTMIWLP